MPTTNRRRPVLLALLALALATTVAPTAAYSPASAEECQVIDAAVGSGLAVTLAVPPEQIMPLGDPEARAVFDQGSPPLAKGQPAVDISRCLRANRPHDVIPGSDKSLIVSRATIDVAAGRAVILYDHTCGSGGVIRLTRDRNGDWTRGQEKMMWQHICDLPPVFSGARR